MSDILYQNQDIENSNPLHVPIDEDENSKTTTTKKNVIPTDPKIKLLIVLGVIVVILLIISLIVTTIRNQQPRPQSPKITPTPFVTPLPTEITNINKIPPDLKIKFDTVDGLIQTNINFPPPQIDTEIGL